MKLKSYFLSIALMLSAGAAHAVPVQADFTAAFSNGPISSLSGSVVYEAVDQFSAIQSLTSIDLNLNGHVYTLGEVGFQDFGGIALVGGLVNGLNAISGTSFNDFFLVFNYQTSQFASFAYSTPGVNLHPIATRGTVSINPAVQVAEPATLAMFAMAAFGLLFARRRKAAGATLGR